MRFLSSSRRGWPGSCSSLGLGATAGVAKAGGPAGLGVPPDVARAVGSLSDLSALKQLHRLAAKILDLNQLREKLKAAGVTP